MASWYNWVTRNKLIRLDQLVSARDRIRHNIAFTSTESITLERIMNEEIAQITKDVKEHI